MKIYNLCPKTNVEEIILNGMPPNSRWYLHIYPDVFDYEKAQKDLREEHVILVSDIRRLQQKEMDIDYEKILNPPEFVTQISSEDIYNELDIMNWKNTSELIGSFIYKEHISIGNLGVQIGNNIHNLNKLSNKYNEKLSSFIKEQSY